MRSPLSIPALFAVCLTLVTGCATTQPQTKANPARLRAMHVVTVADDFVVNVYHNGVPVPEAKRKLVLDRFGATIERTNIEVQQGDWLVFHVVNNRLRWGGAYYFSAAGVLARGECGFVSDLTSGNWSACDSPAAAEKFISQKNYLSDHHAVAIERPWHEGTMLMKQQAGDNWNGAPIWGRERSTWLKVIVP